MPRPATPWSTLLVAWSPHTPRPLIMIRWESRQLAIWQFKFIMWIGVEYSLSRWSWERPCKRLSNKNPGLDYFSHMGWHKWAHWTQIKDNPVFIHLMSQVFFLVPEKYSGFWRSEGGRSLSTKTKTISASCRRTLLSQGGRRWNGQRRLGIALSWPSWPYGQPPAYLNVSLQITSNFQLLTPIGISGICLIPAKVGKMRWGGKWLAVGLSRPIKHISLQNHQD